MKDLLQVFKAVASAMVGVGKKDNLVKDFERTERQGPWAYIIVALIMVAIFIGIIITAVRFALA